MSKYSVVTCEVRESYFNKRVTADEPESHGLCKYEPTLDQERVQ